MAGRTGSRFLRCSALPSHLLLQRCPGGGSNEPRTLASAPAPRLPDKPTRRTPVPADATTMVTSDGGRALRCNPAGRPRTARGQAADCHDRRPVPGVEASRAATIVRRAARPSSGWWSRVKELRGSRREPAVFTSDVPRSSRLLRGGVDPRWRAVPHPPCSEPIFRGCNCVPGPAPEACGTRRPLRIQPAVARHRDRAFPARGG